MRIGFGNDHAAVGLKKVIMKYLEEKGHECVDFGISNEGDKIDYPIAGERVAKAVVNKEVDKAVLICGTGVGISIAANKVKGIRACVCSEPYSAKMSVCHNDANIIAFGARVVGEEMAKMIVDEFFMAKFEGDRHEKRVDLISKIEREYSK